MAEILVRASEIKPTVIAAGEGKDMCVFRRGGLTPNRRRKLTPLNEQIRLSNQEDIALWRGQYSALAQS